MDTAAIKSIAVFGGDIDHTGVGKITKLFPRHCAREFRCTLTCDQTRRSCARKLRSVIFPGFYQRKSDIECYSRNGRSEDSLRAMKLHESAVLCVQDNVKQKQKFEIAIRKISTLLAKSLKSYATCRSISWFQVNKI